MTLSDPNARDLKNFYLSVLESRVLVVGEAFGLKCKLFSSCFVFRFLKRA